MGAAFSLYEQSIDEAILSIDRIRCLVRSVKMTIDDDRRSGSDRRKNDPDLPVLYDRRSRDGRRKPELEVEELSEKCWEMYFKNSSSASRLPGVG